MAWEDFKKYLNEWTSWYLREGKMVGENAAKNDAFTRGNAARFLKFGFQYFHEKYEKPVNNKF